MFEYVHHIGYIVPNMDEAVEFFQRTFGLKLVRREKIQSANMEIGLFAIGPTTLELMMPLKPEGHLHRFLQERGPGIQHVSFAVHGIDAETPGLLQKGVRFGQGQAAQVSAVGWKNLSVLPESARGLTGIEMTEP